MIKRAVGDDKRFEVSAMEIERGGLSYMVETLEALAGEHPGAELVLIVGMDTVATLDKWKNPDRIFELAKLAVLARYKDQGLAWSGPMTVVGTRRFIDVSSSEIRPPSCAPTASHTSWIVTSCPSCVPGAIAPE